MKSMITRRMTPAAKESTPSTKGKSQGAPTFGCDQCSSGSVKMKKAPTAPADATHEEFNIRDAKMAYFTDPFNVPKYTRRVY